MGIKDRLLGRKEPVDVDDYAEVDLTSAEADAFSETALYVRIATITELKESQIVKNEIYEGNIVIVDISKLRMDKINCERMLKDFKQVASDVGGDIVGLGDQHYVILTPRNVRISRERLGGGGRY
jgi:uncharacterized protein